MFLIILFLSFMFVNAQHQARIPIVRGTLLSTELSTLPFGSRIIISLQDVAARRLNTVVLSGSFRFPIPFEIPYPSVQMNPTQPYSIQARIERDGQLIYVNDQYTPVQSTSPVNVFMKKTGNTYRTGYQKLTNVYICQLTPDPGSCFASIRQYYYNAQLQNCQHFIYGGCGGNQNRFPNRDQCERACSNYQRRRNPLNF